MANITDEEERRGSVIFKKQPSPIIQKPDPIPQKISVAKIPVRVERDVQRVEERLASMIADSLHTMLLKEGKQGIKTSELYSLAMA